DLRDRRSDQERPAPREPRSACRRAASLRRAWPSPAVKRGARRFRRRRPAQAPLDRHRWQMTNGSYAWSASTDAPILAKRKRPLKRGRSCESRISPGLFVGVVDHRLEFLGIALDGEHNGAFLDAIRGGRNSGNDLPAIWEAIAHREGAVR